VAKLPRLCNRDLVLAILADEDLTLSSTERGDNLGPPQNNGRVGCGLPPGPCEVARIRPGTQPDHQSLFKAGTGSATMVTPDQIRERMEVVGNDGLHVGVIDRVEAGEIRLAKNDTPDGLHHFLPLANVKYVDDRVHLNRSSIRAMAEWR
jgi:hypothetical protein